VSPSGTERTLAWLLRPFVKIRPEEAITTILMTLIAFILMTGYYLLKTAREPLILLQWGAEAKLYAEACQALILLAVVRVYGAIARRVGRMKLLASVYLFFASNMVVFAALARTNLHIGLAFFLWVGVFSYTSVAQLWAFAADIFTEEQGKRLFAFVGTGSSVGSVVGSALAHSLVRRGPAVLMLGAAAFVVVCVALLGWVELRTDSSSAQRADLREQPVAVESPLQLLIHDNYLVLIGALTLALNCVSGLGDYVLDRTLLAHVSSAGFPHAEASAFIGTFKSSFFGWYNGLALLLQLFAVSRILVRFGVRTALLVLPVVAVFGYGAYAILPTLSLIRAVVISNRALDYSLTSTARHALFLVASRTEKYVGKTLVDSVGARSGDLLSAIVVWFGLRSGMHPTGFAASAVVISLGWIAVVLAIGRENKRRASGVEFRMAVSPM